MSTAWDKLPRESSSAYERFLHYRDQGPERTQTATAERFGVSKASLSETAQRFRWIGRAKAWDQAIERHPLPAVPKRLLEAAGTVSERAANPIDPVSAEVREAEQEHEAMLEIFRQEAEAVGRSQMKLARGFTAAAGKNVARLMASEKPLTARDVATLAQVSCTLAASATSLWGRAIGVDRLLAQMQSVVQMEQREVEEAEIVG